jgi:hypothetical protein
MSEGKRKRLTPAKRAFLLLGCLACAWIKGQLLYEAFRDGKAWFPRSQTTTAAAVDPEGFWLGVGMTSFWLVFSLVLAGALASDWLQARRCGTTPPTGDTDAPVG